MTSQLWEQGPYLPHPEKIRIGGGPVSCSAALPSAICPDPTLLPTSSAPPALPSFGLYYLKGPWPAGSLPPRAWCNLEFLSAGDSWIWEFQDHPTWPVAAMVAGQAVSPQPTSMPCCPALELPPAFRHQMACALGTPGSVGHDSGSQKYLKVAHGPWMICSPTPFNPHPHIPFPSHCSKHQFLPHVGFSPQGHDTQSFLFLANSLTLQVSAPKSPPQGGRP